MLKISYAGCLGLSATILVQFTIKRCVSKKPIISAGYDKQHVCT